MPMLEAVNPNAEALAILRRELTPGARAALAHLLNNGLCSVVIQLLRETIRQVLAHD
jgi:hypothetical protein